jgi:lipoprotein-anchoring transpeptidase ErfK/SrfK
LKTRAAAAVRTAIALAVTVTAPGARGDAPLPPWVGEGEVPPPSWARSVVAKPSDAGPRQPAGLVLFSEPNRASSRRGVGANGASLPFFGTRRGSGCTGSWWLVGPLAWTCSDDANLSAEAAEAPPRVIDAGGLSAQYAFIQSAGASAYASIEAAEEGEADQELEGSWAVAVVERRERWARTTKGLWIAQQDLALARPSTFQGTRLVDGVLDVAWVVADRAGVWASATPSAKDKPKETRPRFQLVHVREESGAMVRVEDGAWMFSRDLARATRAPVPVEVTGAGERWIDVDSSSQTLVAYEGPRPVYATLVSTGRGAPGSTSVTPPGVHRIWVKIFASDMANVQSQDIEPHYSLEDVPYVQFFNDAVALHGTYWHGDFGHPRSHGCVNLSPLDARWMFDFTEPRVPAGWDAAYPASIDPGSVVRVR